MRALVVEDDPRIQRDLRAALGARLTLGLPVGAGRLEAVLLTAAAQLLLEQPLPRHDVLAGGTGVDGADRDLEQVALERVEPVGVLVGLVVADEQRVARDPGPEHGVGAREAVDEARALILDVQRADVRGSEASRE